VFGQLASAMLRLIIHSASDALVVRGLPTQVHAHPSLQPSILLLPMTAQMTVAEGLLQLSTSSNGTSLTQMGVCMPTHMLHNRLCCCTSVHSTSQWSRKWRLTSHCHMSHTRNTSCRQAVVGLNACGTENGLATLLVIQQAVASNSVTRMMAGGFVRTGFAGSSAGLGKCNRAGHAQ
jgi:hypothetical protein